MTPAEITKLADRIDAIPVEIGTSIERLLSLSSNQLRAYAALLDKQAEDARNWELNAHCAKRWHWLLDHPEQWPAMVIVNGSRKGQIEFTKAIDAAIHNEGERK